MKSLPVALLLVVVLVGCGGEGGADPQPTVSEPLFYRGTSSYFLPPNPPNSGNPDAPSGDFSNVLTVASVWPNGQAFMELFPSTTRLFTFDTDVPNRETGDVDVWFQANGRAMQAPGKTSAQGKDGRSYVLDYQGRRFFSATVRRIPLPKHVAATTVQDGVYTGEAFLVTNASSGMPGRANGWGLVRGEVRNGEFEGSFSTRMYSGVLLFPLQAGGEAEGARAINAGIVASFDNPRWSGDGSTLILSWENSTHGGSDITVSLRRTGPLPAGG